MLDRLLLLAGSLLLVGGLLSCDASPAGPDRAPVAQVDISPTSAQVALGASQPFAATVRDAQGNPLSGRRVLWSSEDSTIARVSQDGTVSAVGMGSTRIAASSEGEDAIASVVVVRRAVAAVRVAPAAAATVRGGTVQLTATPLDDAGGALSGRSVAWASTDPAVATVDANGLVTGASAGVATIRATAEGVSGDARVTVSSGAPAVAARVGGESRSGTAGEALPDSLAIRVEDAGGAPVGGVSVTWTVASGGGSISPTTSVTGADGIARARWTLGNSLGEQKATGTVTGLPSVTFVAVAAPPAVTGVRVTPESVSFSALGHQVRLTATALDAKGGAVPGVAFAWTSTAPSTASVDAAGLVVAVSNGTARVIGSAGGHADTTVITVRQEVARVVVTPATLTLTAGTSGALTARAEDAGGAPVNDASVSWSSSNTSVAQVDGSGTVSALQAGTATITATSGGRSGTAQVTVNAAPPPPPAPVASVEVTPASRTLEVGGSFDFDAVVRAADGTQLQGRQVSWTSSAPSVASVDGNGLVTAKKAGEATITATSEGKSGTAQVTVTDPPPPPPAPVASVEVTPASRTLEVGESFDFDAIVRAADGTELEGREVDWSSSDTAVASVDGNGLVTAKKAGEATITATSEGKSGTATVTVTVAAPAPAKLERVSGNDQKADRGETLDDPLVVRVVDPDGRPVPGVEVRWSTDYGSLDPAVSTTDANGRAQTRWTLGSGKIKDDPEARATTDALPGQEVVFKAKVDD